MASLLHLVYVSSAKRHFSSEEIELLLAQSRRNNARVGVTGVLLYSEGNIIQVLEGPAEAVQATFERIKRDDRHRGLQVLLCEPKTTRYFPEEPMLFERRRNELRLSAILNGARAASGPVPAALSRAHKLLVAFDSAFARR